MDWLEETRALLRKAPREITLTRIAHDTGLQLTWLSAFERGKMIDPGIRKVQKLYNYLKETQAALDLTQGV